MRQRRAIDSVLKCGAHLVTAAVRQQLLPEARIERLARTFLATNAAHSLDPILTAVGQQAVQLLARHGFKPRRSRGRTMSLLIEGEVLFVGADSSMVNDLSGMRRWADVATREIVAGAIGTLGRDFWCCNSLGRAYLHGVGSMSELADLAQAAVIAKKMPSMDTLWTQALARTDSEETDDGLQIWGIGNREEFGHWMSSMLLIYRSEHEFINAAPTGKVDRKRCTAVRDWARRVVAFCGEASALRGLDSESMERGENRDFGECTIVIFDPDVAPYIDRYFHETEMGNGEVPGIEFKMDATGQGPLTGMLFAMVGGALLSQLQDLTE